MAEFCGTWEEFNKFLSGYCRNKVLALTNANRKARGNCQYCGEVAELQSAHIKGQERVKIIKDILDKHFRNGDAYEVNLNKFEDLFMNSHKPIQEHFYFLCGKCHRDYDNGKLSDESIQNKIVETMKRSYNGEKKSLPKTSAHKWTLDDERAALNAFLENIPQREANKIGEERGMGANSFWLKIQNFKYLATNGANGTSGYSNQCERIWNEYRNHC